MAGINVTKLKEISVLLPPLDLQKRFEEFVCVQRAIANKQREANSKEQSLFNSLVQRAFRGDL